MSPIESAVPTKFATIAVLDFETCNLPSHNHNKTAITELCIYGFAAKLLATDQNGYATNTLVSAEKSGPKELVMPRVQHKLTLLFNPDMMVHPESERMTGLNNYILEHESKFDKNAAEMVLGFLQHLPQPVCLVAHNGWGFDFPILRNSFKKLNMNLPDNIVCVDSLRAFLEIDKKVQTIALTAQPSVETTVLEQISKESNSTTEILEDPLIENSQFNWRQINESTPKRPPTSTASNAAKRKLLNDCNGNLSANDADSLLSVKVDINEIETTPVKKSAVFKSRRSLNFGADASPVIKKYPPRGVYKLEPMYKRIFNNSQTVDAHHAEGDVQMLMKLILHYGEDFMAYAEQHAKPLSEVPALGRY